ncbi:MAG: NADPH-dependent glutamate synthase [Nitrospirota bacterium]
MDEKKPKRAVVRTPMPEQPADVRRKNFNEVALGYTMEQAMQEAQRCLQCKTPVCEKGCPVEVNIKEFVGFIAKGDIPGAYRKLLETNSLPAVCGRVCPQEVQCEKDCVLAKKGQPVCIGRLERFAADQFAATSACEQTTGTSACKPVDANLKVACIGSGPSSLTVAGYLAGLGVKVTVFEALHELGGVLVYGIPEFRLPKGIVRREIDAMKSLGVEFVTNYVGGKTFTIQELFDQGYKAVFIGVGAGLPWFLGIPGENLIGVFSSNEYLTRANLGRAYEFPKWDTPTFAGKNVVVFGGGNVAMDAARTALRMGADNVTIAYRRTKAEMPARLEELHHAIEEGVQLELLCAPMAFLGDDKGYLRAIKLQKMCLGEPDASGRCSPVPIEDEYFELICDLTVVAVGTGPNPILLSNTPGLKLNRKGYIQVNEETQETSIPNVYAGGDISTGSATVIAAMGAGRKAAKAIYEKIMKEKA